MTEKLDEISELDKIVQHLRADKDIEFDGEYCNIDMILDHLSYDRCVPRDEFTQSDVDGALEETAERIIQSGPWKVSE